MHLAIRQRRYAIRDRGKRGSVINRIRENAITVDADVRAQQSVCGLQEPKIYRNGVLYAVITQTQTGARRRHTVVLNDKGETFRDAAAIGSVGRNLQIENCFETAFSEALIAIPSGPCPEGRSARHLQTVALDRSRTPKQEPLGIKSRRIK